VLTQIK